MSIRRALAVVAAVGLGLAATATPGDSVAAGQASASLDGTTVPPAAEIVDALGAAWTMSGEVILRNGAPAAGGTGVRILWSGGSIYVLSTHGGNWWRWLGAGWTNVGPAQPGGPPPVTGPTVVAQTVALNGYKRVLDGQWQGIRYASDGNVYFGSSTHSAHHGAAFFRYDPRSGQVTLLADDITIVAGEDPQTNPQGKLHSDIVEANGWLYMSTHFSSEGPGAYGRWSGSHVIGYQLATGAFRDYGVVHPNYTSYSGIGVDPVRNQLYVYVTGQNPTDVSYIYRIDAATGAKTNLGQVGEYFRHSFWTFVDRRGDVWFSLSYSNGDLRRIRADTGVIDLFPNALPPLTRWDVAQVNPSATEQAARWITWMQPLDGDRALFTLGNYGGMLYLFDATRPIGSGQEFQALKHLGSTDLGMALAGNRLFYYQRENRGFGHQEAQDFHLLSVSLDPAAGYPITDHGLLIDPQGRRVWRVPGMMTDGRERVFMIGDWWIVAGDLGTLRYNYSGGVESYQQLPRGQFFAVASVPGPSGPAALSALLLSPAAVLGGATTTGNRVSLGGPAPPGGYTVALASGDPSLVEVPAAVVVAEGATASADFAIATGPVAGPVPVTITASAGGVTRTAILTVSPLELSSLTLSPATLNAGTAGTANVARLNGPAPPAGVTVVLSSSHPSIAAVPASVVVPGGGDASPAFTVAAGAVSAATTVTISASLTTDAGWTTTRSASVTVTPSSSADGTTVPPAAQIIDGGGVVWTMSGAAILRNGVSAAGGSGVRILWSGGSIYVLGSPGGSWWRWLGSGWTNIGTAPPGGTVTPPSPPTPAGSPSAEGTAVPPATQIVDAQSAVWTLSGGAVLRNGVSAAGGSGVRILWTGGSIYVLGSTGGSWWRWGGSGWTNVGTAPPGGTVTPPSPPTPRPSGTPSADGTVVPPATQIVDALGAVWTLNAGVVLRNGTGAAGGTGFRILWLRGVVYVLGSDNARWWRWAGTGWASFGTTPPV